MVKLRLAQILKEQGLSKRRFAKLIGIEYNNVFRLFRPGYDPRLSTLATWAKALGVRIADLYDEPKGRRARRGA